MIVSTHYLRLLSGKGKPQPPNELWNIGYSFQVLNIAQFHCKDCVTNYCEFIPSADACISFRSCFHSAVNF